MVAAAVLTGQSQAATFSVGNENDLSTAISNVNGNDQDDTINITADITLTGDLPALGNTGDDEALTIDSNGHTIDGNDKTRIFFANSGTITVKNATLKNGKAKGGHGGDGAGGGAGLGGAIFVRSGADVTVEGVSLDSNAAQGGDGGATVTSDFGGGGGLGEDGKADGTAGTAGHGLGGGFGSGGDAHQGGGFGGGGGGGKYGDFGGFGGFGGGGGGGSSGGYGGSSPLISKNGGGGGAGFGGAIFVMEGGSITVRDGGVSGGSVTTGAVGIGAKAEGSGFFLQGTAGLSVDVTASQSVTIDDAIASDAGQADASTGQDTGLTKTGPGTLTLSGDNTYTGGTTVSAGTLVGDTDSLQSDITNNAAVEFNQANTGTYGGDMTGTGSLTKTGDGTLTLDGTNTYSGGTTVDAGTLVGDTDSLQGEIVNNGIVLFDQTADGTYAGNMSGSGHMLKYGTGTLTLGGEYTHTGFTLVQTGTLRLGDDERLPDEGPVAINSGTFDLAGHNETIGTLSEAGGATGNVTLGAGRLTLSGGEFGGVISGTGGLTKTGSGTLTLTGNNAYTGGTTLASGILAITNPNALGSGTLTIEGGTFTPPSGFDLKNPFSVNGDFTVGGSSVTLKHSGGVDLNSGERHIDVRSGNQLRLSGAITNGSLVIDSGYADFANTASQSFEALTLNNNLSVLRSNAVSAQTALNLGSGAEVLFYDQAKIRALSGSGDIDLTHSGFESLRVEGNDSTTFSGDITVTGKPLVHAGTGSLTLTGDTGGLNFEIADGSLILNGEHSGGNVTLTGGTFNGSGTIGSLTADAGTVAPGNSIGTTTVTGDVAFNPGSTYDAEINGDGSSDKIDATGKATLADGSTVNVVVEGNGELIEHGDQWTILSADDGVSDNGATVTSNFAGFDFAGDVSGSNYRLTAEADAIAPTQTDPRARRVAQALDADAEVNPDIAALRTRVGNMSPAQAEVVLTQSRPGHVEASHANALRTRRASVGTLQSYLEGRRAGLPTLAGANQGRGRSTQGDLLAVASNDPRTLAAMMDQPENAGADAMLDGAGSSASDDSPWGGFVTTYGVQHDRDPHDGLLGAQADTYAGQFGLDRKLNEQVLAGLSFTYAHSQTDFDAGLGSADADSFRLGPYFSYSEGPWFADASATYGFRKIDQSRRAPMLGETFEADYNAHELAAGVNAGYDWNFASDWTLTPGAGVQYVYTRTESYQETGGPGAISVDQADFHSLRSTLDLTLANTFELGGVSVQPSATVGWAHEYLEDDGNVTARFVGGKTPFALATAGSDEDTLYYGGGAAALLDENTSLGLHYRGETGEHSQTHALVGSLSLRF